MTSLVRTVTALAPGRVELLESEEAELAPGEVAGVTIVTLLSPGTEMAIGLPLRSCSATPTAQMPSVCSSRS